MNNKQDQKGGIGSGLLLWLVGVPIPIIILLAIIM